MLLGTRNQLLVLVFEFFFERNYFMTGFIIYIFNVENKHYKSGQKIVDIKKNLKPSSSNSFLYLKNT